MLLFFFVLRIPSFQVSLAKGSCPAIRGKRGIHQRRVFGDGEGGE